MQSATGVFRRVGHSSRPEPAPREGRPGEAATGILASLGKSVPRRNHTSESDLSNSRRQRVGNGGDEEQVKAVWRQEKVREGNSNQRPARLGV